jgi:plastocyanin
MNTTARRRLLLAAVTCALAIAGLPAPVRAASQTVTMKDNFFDPKEVHIDPGDTIIWTNQGSRQHMVKSDTGEFKSERLSTGERFDHTFTEEGYYFYHCALHGAKGRVGMWGVIIVGNPPPPPDYQQAKDARPKLVVPKDFPTIQKAVNHASPGSTIRIKPGVYKEDVVVTTRNLVIEGVDRFRTILHGEDKRENGFLVDGTRRVTIRNLTVRNYLANGIFFNNTKGYTVNHVDAIKGRTYGVYAYQSYDGVFKNSFGWGSGDSAFYVGGCLGCSALLENLHSEKNFLGYSGTNATGVVIRDSTFVHNGAGIVPNTLPTEPYAPNRGTFIYNNIVRSNNYTSVPAAGFSETAGIPFGTGVWLAGTMNNIVKNNMISNHDRYGVLVSQSIDPDSIPMNNTVIRNFIRESAMYDLAWDGTGSDNCFSHNDYEGSTGPPEMETLYACANRPFVGAPYPPVQADIAASLAGVATREQKEPPEPDRPRCQRGRPGCRHQARSHQ